MSTPVEGKRWPLTPTRAELEAYLARGLTSQQIADEHNAATGLQLTSSAIRMALHKFELSSAKPPPRDSVIPESWRPMSDRYKGSKELKQVRRWGKIQRGEPLSQDPIRAAEARREFDVWLANLRKQNMVITYSPERGYYRRPRRAGDGEVTGDADDPSAQISA